MNYLTTTCDEWKIEIPRRARRWAAEDAAVEGARVVAFFADRDRRKAAWPVERIRALMATARDAS